MIHVNRLNFDIIYLLFVFSAKLVALVFSILAETASFLDRFHKQFSVNTKVNGNFWVQELNVNYVVKVGM